MNARPIRFNGSVLARGNQMRGVPRARYLLFASVELDARVAEGRQDRGEEVVLTKK